MNGPAEPNTARIRDYWLGGEHHTTEDRELANEILVCAPNVAYLVRIQREFLRRAVRHLVGAGVRQFLDLGSGLPTVGNVHEVAQDLAPDAQVVYVDLDPVVAEEGRKLVSGVEGAEFLQGDLRRPDEILEAANLLDLDKPVAVLMVDILHFVKDADDPERIVADYFDRLVPGSHVALTHTSKDEGLLAAIKRFNTMYGLPLPELTFREPDRIARLCAGLDIVDPGIVPIPMWNPDLDPGAHLHPENFRGYAVVGRKP